MVKYSQVITLREKGAHGSGIGSEQISILSPQCSQRGTLRPNASHHVCTATSSNRQLMTTKPKALHVSTRDRQLTVAPVHTVELKPPPPTAHAKTKLTRQSVMVCVWGMTNVPQALGSTPVLPNCLRLGGVFASSARCLPGTSLRPAVWSDM